jgi:short-subunit dehydrogenase involved in D-alanine esterification of teichoic acids
MSVIGPGNVAVITGGASGIGLALAEEMRHAPVERMERAESQTNPSMFGAA